MCSFKYQIVKYIFLYSKLYKRYNLGFSFTAEVLREYCKPTVVSEAHPTVVAFKLCLRSSCQAS